MCTFKEFCDAYRNGHLLDLFHSRSLQVKNNPRIQDLLSGRPLMDSRKSVWYLKQSILVEDDTGEEYIVDPSTVLDYGFINCRNASEWKQLMKVYRDFFNNNHGDPLAFHEAAMKGNLYGFLSNIGRGIIRGPKFQRLMRTYPGPNPLPDLRILRRSLCSKRQAPLAISKMQALFFIIGVIGIVLGLFLMRPLPL